MRQNLLLNISEANIFGEDQKQSFFLYNILSKLVAHTHLKYHDPGDAGTSPKFW